MMFRILIADDHGILRAGLRALLNDDPQLQVVAEAADGEEAIDLVAQHQPDIVLLDMNMPGLNGVEATRVLLSQHPTLKVLILTVHEDFGLVREALQAGASGYIIKRAVESEPINAIKAVARGEIYVHPAMTRALLETPTEHTAVSPNTDQLTNREVDVLRLLVQGYTNKQIGEKLNISIRTVETHRSNITSKLGINSRVELLRFANQNGLVSFD
ncbi:MAG: response regulator transcription factor [Chloroflexota bacterium]